MASGRWIHNRAIQTFEKDGLRYASGLLTDITQRKAAEESLRESEQRYRLLFERNLAGVFRCSQVGSFLDCNDAGAKILGYDSREDLIGRPVTDVFFDLADKSIADQKMATYGTASNQEMLSASQGWEFSLDHGQYHHGTRRYRDRN